MDIIVLAAVECEDSVPLGAASTRGLRPDELQEESV